MEKLWAPWRGKFVSNISDDDECFLCRVLKEDNDGDNYVLKRGEKVFAILNRYPYNTGHLMVVPNRHVAEFEELDEDESLELLRMTKRMIVALKGSMYPHGINVGMNLGRSAGAGVVGHIHLHIVPRWDGDTNFMPVIGGTKVLPHDLPTVFKLLEDRL
ncbi:MAG: HIT domain-containing protein [Planctomycetota bacterium]|nr:HIT domain-containing protein [Planctomycetota bacterium]